jgi:hypothetical protein
MVICNYRKEIIKMKVLFRYFKKADKTLNRIVIPKHLIEKYGREFYLEVLEDETIKLIPARKEK